MTCARHLQVEGGTWYVYAICTRSALFADTMWPLIARSRADPSTQPTQVHAPQSSPESDGPPCRAPAPAASEDVCGPAQLRRSLAVLRAQFPPLVHSLALGGALRSAASALAQEPRDLSADSQSHQRLSRSRGGGQQQVVQCQQRQVVQRQQQQVG